MALLHHWDRHASFSITTSANAHELWQGVFPRVAFKHAFVMSALLGISALHLAHLHENHRQYYLIEAARHHGDAVQGLRKNLEHITPEISDALFACATLNSVYIFTAAGPLADGVPEHGTAVSIKHRTLGTDWIPHIRGVGIVLRPVYEYVSQGPFAPALRSGHWDLVDPDIDPGLEDEVFRDLKAAWIQDPAKDIYDESIQHLRRCSSFMAHLDDSPKEGMPEYGYNGPWSGPFIWLHSVPQEFFMRLDQRQPCALLVFAHFGAILQRIDNFWIMSGWGRRIVSVVDEMLGNYWDRWIQWPRKVVGFDQA